MNYSRTFLLTLAILSALTSHLSFAAKPNISRELASVRRVGHARELLGNRYKKSIVSTFESHEGLEKNILNSVRRGLPRKFKATAEEITKTIMSEAARHSLDPYFVMAVIAGESSFNPLATGPVGEIGLMQIRPTTGKWMAEMTKIKWRGEASLREPITNIKLGTAYLAWLREKFQKHGQPYLAAYNMGPRSVRAALERNIWPKDYPRHVMKRYLSYYRSI